jgi:hypothetical protein
MSDKVWMEHPALGPERRQLVDRKLLDQVWSKSGWVFAGEAAQEDSQDLVDLDYALGEPSTEEE